jgi:hypothetical protein
MKVVLTPPHTAKYSYVYSVQRENLKSRKVNINVDLGFIKRSTGLELTFHVEL